MRSVHCFVDYVFCFVLNFVTPITFVLNLTVWVNIFHFLHVYPKYFMQFCCLSFWIWWISVIPFYLKRIWSQLLFFFFFNCIDRTVSWKVFYLSVNSYWKFIVKQKKFRAYKLIGLAKTLQVEMLKEVALHAGIKFKQINPFLCLINHSKPRASLYFLQVSASTSSSASSS